MTRDALLRRSAFETYKLYIPERGPRRPFDSILPCPERIYVAWHKDAKGIFELLDENGHRHGFPPQETLWQVRTYQRTLHYPETREAFYEKITDA